MYRPCGPLEARVEGADAFLDDLQRRQGSLILLAGLQGLDLVERLQVLKRQGAIPTVDVQIHQVGHSFEILNQPAGDIGPPLHHVVLDAFDDRGSQQRRLLHALADQLLRAVADVQGEQDTKSQQQAGADAQENFRLKAVCERHWPVHCQSPGSAVTVSPHITGLALDAEI